MHISWGAEEDDTVVTDTLLELVDLQKKHFSNQSTSKKALFEPVDLKKNFSNPSASKKALFELVDLLKITFRTSRPHDSLSQRLIESITR